VTESTILGPDGVTVIARIVDNGDGTGVRYNYDADGNVTSQDDLTGLPVQTWPAMDNAGALATLLVIEGTLTLEDAANSQRTVPDHLIAEAEAWSVATTPPAP